MKWFMRLVSIRTQSLGDADVGMLIRTSDCTHSHSRHKQQAATIRNSTQYVFGVGTGIRGTLIYVADALSAE